MQAYFILPSQEILKHGGRGVECTVAHFHEASQTPFFTLHWATQGHSNMSRVKCVVYYFNSYSKCVFYATNFKFETEISDKRRLYLELTKMGRFYLRVMNIQLQSFMTQTCRDILDIVIYK